MFVDDVRVTRCVSVEGSGSSYLVGAEFVQTRSAGEGSIRRAVGHLLRTVTPPAPTLRAKKAARNGRRTEGVSGDPVVNRMATRGEGEVMKELIARFVREDEGQDLIEYGLLAGIITAAAVTAITEIAPKVEDYIQDLNAALPAAD
jgi:pilus assembly protein Flp/PilA